MLEIIKNGLVYILEVHWRSLKRGSFSKMDNEHKKISNVFFSSIQGTSQHSKCICWYVQINWNIHQNTLL